MFKYILIVLILIATPLSPANGQKISLNYAPSPADNPVRGLVPYRGQAEFNGQQCVGKSHFSSSKKVSSH